MSSKKILTLDEARELPREQWPTWESPHRFEGGGIIALTSAPGGNTWVPLRYLPDGRPL